MTEEEIADLRLWGGIHGLDTLSWDAAARITNWDEIRDGLHKALNEVERLRAQLAELHEFAEVLYSEAVRASEY